MDVVDPGLLIGKKVYLREMSEEDAPYIVSWRNDPEIKKWMFNQEILTLENHYKWFIKFKPNRIDFIICDKKTDQPIGTVNFVNIRKDEAEAGKMLGDKKYWGGGYAKEAFIIWLNIGFNAWGFKRITVKTKKNNIVNIGLNKKLGFIEAKISKLRLKPGNFEEEVVEMEISKSIFNERNLNG